MVNEQMKKYFDIFRSAIFAGICIGIAGYGFLAGKTIGMFLFIFGLATVVSYKLKLFTGTAGFVSSWRDMGDLFIILLGNICGCALISLIARCSPMPLQEEAATLLNARLNAGIWQCGVLAIGCGILMTTAVYFARKSKEIGNWIPLLFAVPLFIHCGFPHCIADIFYYITVPFDAVKDQLPQVIGLYACIVTGNFIGCNLYRGFITPE